jgi:hypothetical protein
LNIYWPTSPIHKDPTGRLHRAHAQDFVSDLLGDEQKGGLTASLKDAGWAQSLGVGPAESLDDVLLLSMEIVLTDAGLSHVDDVVALLPDDRFARSEWRGWCSGKWLQNCCERAPEALGRIRCAAGS